MPKSKRTQRPHGSNTTSGKRPPSGNNASGAQPAAGARPATNTEKRPASNSGRPAATAPVRPSAANATRSPTARNTSNANAPAKSQARAALSPGAARRRRQQLPWWRQSRSITVGGVLLGVVAIIVLFVALARISAAQNAEDTQLASASLISAVTSVSAKTSDAVGTGGLPNPFHALPGAAALNGPSGKPEVLYIGGEYCPFCAADRWSLIVALSRFGSFSNLHTVTSSGSDSYANTPTFTFYGSTYQSQYIDFVGVEAATRDPNTPLQTPTSDQQTLAAKYGSPPYVPASAANSIPFVDFGNHYVTVGSGYVPSVLTGYTWDQIAAALDNPASPISKNVVGNANYITAAICKLTNNQPASACSSSAIQQIVGQLPKGQ